ncbi:hypothetical protein FSARC_4147 [Fusarium sarcochroum]|uniref:NAD(P)-binding domain-containing protein n=1 Tax=Fusarium sarcochroum TaxID=1208366 RepID=A0A8H4U2S3_9HYPO|nr:hypothetical protein FSARC_4147 [Fusarium sarcochroum]
MSSVSPKIIIFGAAGAVGRTAALEAQSRGAQVTLAMRDVNKPIPDLAPEVEKQRNFKRIKADLADPTSIQQAVTESQATVAFTYILPSAQDGLLSTFEAMKNAGIKYVVLLSSYTIYQFGDAKSALEGSNAISVLHAKAELALAKSGLPYTALRPMYFASNIQTLEDWDAIMEGNLEMALPDAPFDYVAPEDIGAIAGARLVEPPPSSGVHELPICGPELLPQRDAWSSVSKALGIDLTITEIDVEGLRQKFAKKGWPEPLVEANVVYVVNVARDPSYIYPTERYQEGSTSHKRYTGREPTKFSTWVERHKDELLSGKGRVIG